MRTTRRQFAELAGSALVGGVFARNPAFAYPFKKQVRFKVGVTDWNLKQEAKVDSLALAKKVGFDGVQISLGVGRDRLPLSDSEVQKSFITESRRVGLPIASVCLNILHRNILKSDSLGQRWVADSIPIARALGVRVILLPFFGNGALKTQAEM